MANKSRRRLTDEERDERRRADRERLQKSAEQLLSSDGWQRWIRVRSHAGLARLSLSNQLLVAIARPDATFVAGLKAWLRLGYAVRKGERAVAILAPVPIKDRDKTSGEETDNARLLFKTVFVFDDQVTPLPPPAIPAPLEPPIRDVDGDELAEVIPSFVQLAETIGCSVAFEPIAGGAHGYYQPSTERIVVDYSLSANQRVKTLCHELAHALVRHDRQPEDPALDYACEELVAESIAYTCLGALGVPSEDYSIPYLASWAENSDLEVLEHTAALVDRLARRIEDVALGVPS
jgi:antirestriction protein ArdC